MDRHSGGTGGARARPGGAPRAAAAALRAAGQRLHRLTVAALTGRAYDPDAYDAAILAVRRARARAVREAWRRWPAPPAPRAAAAA